MAISGGMDDFDWVAKAQETVKSLIANRDHFKELAISRNGEIHDLQVKLQASEAECNRLVSIIQGRHDEVTALKAEIALLKAESRCCASAAPELTSLDVARDRKIKALREAMLELGMPWDGTPRHPKIRTILAKAFGDAA